MDVVNVSHRGNTNAPNTGAYMNGSDQRTSSLTSFSSFTSNQSYSTVRNQNRIPRGSSTNELLSIESNFTKPSRSKTHALITSRNSSMVSTSNPRLVRGSSVPSIPRFNSFQSGSTNDLFIAQQFNTPPNGNGLYHNNRQPQRPNLKPQKYHSHDNIAAINPTKQQVLSPLQRSIPQQKIPISHQRPGRPIPNAPFTFPNGEVYIPRNKQRNSYSDLNRLNTPGGQHVVKRASLPELGPGLVPNFHSSQSSSISSSSSNSHTPLTLKIPNTHQITSEQDLDNEINEKNFINSTNTNASNSTSPSPSRNSRTSVNESTPPSSIDDLTIHTQLDFSNVSNGDLNIQSYPLSNNPHNLDKIDEHQDTAMTPTSEVSEKTIEVKKTSSSKSTMTSSTKDSSKKSTATFAKNASTPSLNLTKTNQTSSSRVSTIKSEAPIQRKPSALKRFISKVFTSSKKSKKNKTTTQIPSSQKLQPASIPTQKAPQFNKPIVIPTINVEQARKPKNDDSFDQFSFVEGDEDDGIKIASKNSSSEEFKSEDVLESMFQNLNTDDSNRAKLEQKTTASTLVDSKETSTTDESKQIPSHQDPMISTVEDDEDQVLQFDDIEMINKLIEYGETSFPDLASPDFGQSQRKIMRSKSIERKKSIRSISSSSTQQAEQVQEQPQKWKSSQQQQQQQQTIIGNINNNGSFEIINSNQPRDPLPMIQSRPSILKKSRNGGHSNNDSINNNHNSNNNNNNHNNYKRVEFTNKIFVNDTYPSYLYNRHSRSLSSYQLVPQAIQNIRLELNEFKKSMKVHKDSESNTQFFRA